jgi:hypothetical protein
MPDHGEFCRQRPFLYHLTDRRNLPRIAEVNRLVCANDTIRDGARPELSGQRRTRHTVVVVNGAEVRIRDQAPLREGQIAFEPGWNLARLVELLNSLVYFWPGTAQSPSVYGLRHLGRYLNEEPVVLKVPTAEMFRLNPRPLFCRYNSGSPRFTGGRASPRGSATFQAHPEDRLRANQVVEVVFERAASLPEDTQVLAIGEWSDLMSVGSRG